MKCVTITLNNLWSHRHSNWRLIFRMMKIHKIVFNIFSSTIVPWNIVLWLRSTKMQMPYENNHANLECWKLWHSLFFFFSAVCVKNLLQTCRKYFTINLNTNNLLDWSIKPMPDYQSDIHLTELWGPNPYSLFTGLCLLLGANFKLGKPVQKADNTSIKEV